MANLSPLAASVNVAIGGGLGALARYQLGRLITKWLGPQTVSAFPWATFTVNIVGSIFMGVLAGWLMRSGAGESGQSEQLRLFVGIGLLGGFTTFSSFSLELMMLIERGQPGTAFAYGVVSVLAGLSGLYIGLIMMRLAA